ncbi:unnamed protein product [Closterium sp. NIES-64]|nr:unnamed protein product [Closterium sp. NIES-64]
MFLRSKYCVQYDRPLVQISSFFPLSLCAGKGHGQPIPSQLVHLWATVCNTANRLCLFLPTFPSPVLKVKAMASKFHPNLVRLLGYCVQYDRGTSHVEQILVYEYMENRDLESWIGPGPVFKDPYLDAPDDLVLRWARLALSCTAMPAASRPTMNQVLGELVRLKQEAFGVHVSKAISRMDMESGGSVGSSSGFTAELARAEHMGMQSGSLTSGSLS